MQICYEIGFKLSAKMPPCKNLVHFKQNKKKQPATWIRTFE